MMKQCFVLLLSLICCLQIVAQQEVNLEELNITANKISMEKEEIAKPIYEISAEVIESQPASNAAQLLNLIPNLHISEANGTVGSVQNYSMRGGRNKDVLILINGIPMNDHSQISSFEDLNLIPTETIQKIEVIAGGASTLYGSSASAGVINFILKDANDAPNIFAKLQAGKWGGFEQMLQLSGQTENKKVGATLSLRNFDTNGFSAALDTTQNNAFDEDQAKQRNANLALAFNPNQQINVQLLGSINENNYDFDGDAFLDSEDEQENRKRSVQLHSNFQHKKGNFTLKSSLSDYSRETRNPLGLGRTNLSTEFFSKNWNVDAYHNLRLLKNTNVTTGFYAKQAEADSFNGFSGSYMQDISADSAQFSLTDVYAAVAMNEVENLAIHVGGRYHSHSDYDGNILYNGNAKYHFDFTENSTLSLSAGTNTAFITPSVYQLYSVFGSQELIPEESTTYEASISFSQQNLFTLTGNYFTRKEENLIGFSNTTFLYANMDGKSEANGFEADLSITPGKNWTANLFYATTNRDNADEFYRLPAYELGGLFTANIPNWIDASLKLRRVGERVMPLFNSTTFETDLFTVNPYTNAALTASKTVWNNQLRIYATANNLFNEEIVDNLGYSYEDFNLQFGASFSY